MGILCNNLIILLFIFAFGISMGSFLNVLIYRIPNGISILKPSSMCPVCKTKIKPWHNIPVFGWLFLKGKCAYCGTNISVQYPLVEFLSGLLALTVFKINGCNIYSFSIFGVFLLLFGLSLIDLKYKMTPNSLNLTALTLSFFTSPDILSNIKNAFIAMGFLVALKFYISYFKSKETIKESDIITGGTISAIVGIYYALWTLFTALLIAVPFVLYYNFRKQKANISFISFLSIGLLIIWVSVFLSF